MKRFFLSFGRDLTSTIIRTLGCRTYGGASKDHGLALISFTGSLRLDWFARDTRSWDGNQPAGMRAKLFLEQALQDTDAAIASLFLALPREIEVIEIRVFDPIDPRKLILAGAIRREDVDSAITCRSQSIRMKLRTLGVHYSSIKGDRIEGLSIRGGHGAPRLKAHPGK